MEKKFQKELNEVKNQVATLQSNQARGKGSEYKGKQDKCDRNRGVFEREMVD
jgi:hypothetical protein